LTVWNGYRAIVKEGKSDVRRLVPEVNTSGTSANGDTNCGILEQYQRHIKIESIMGNADVAPQSSRTLMQIFMGFLHIWSVSNCKRRVQVRVQTSVWLDYAQLR
jgi:hypothetical protein